MPIPGVRINGTLYAFGVYDDPGLARAIVTLANVTNGERYNIAHYHGIWECDCASFEFAHRQIDNQGCKHVRAVRILIRDGHIQLPHAAAHEPSKLFQ